MSSVFRTCFVCRRTKPLHRFGKAVGRFRVCLRCRSMLEAGTLSEGGDKYIRRRLEERGVRPEDIEAIVKVERRYSPWQILKDTLRGTPKPIQ